MEPDEVAALSSGHCSSSEKRVIPPCRQNHVGNVILHSVPIVSLTIDGKERLCLAQISSTLLKSYSYNEIHNRRVALGITCVQCTPVQLEILRRAGAMPVSSRRCGMISKREAERLVKSFLEETTPPKLPEDFAFDVVHDCGWGCRGQFMPSRYNSSRAKCIKCTLCHSFHSPNKFIFHHHRTAESKYSHPDAANFNSWRRHLKLVTGYQNKDLVYAWEDVKAMFNGGSRKRLMNSATESPSRVQSRLVCSSFANQRKKLKIEDMKPGNDVHKSDLVDYSPMCMYPSMAKSMPVLPTGAVQHNALVPAMYPDRSQNFAAMMNPNTLAYGYNQALKGQFQNPYTHLRLKYPGFFQFFGGGANKQPFVDQQSMFAALSSCLTPYYDQPNNNIEELDTRSPQTSPIIPTQHDLTHQRESCIQHKDPFWSSAFKPVNLQKVSPSATTDIPSDKRAENTSPVHQTGTTSFSPNKHSFRHSEITVPQKRAKHSDFSVESLIKNSFKSSQDTAPTDQEMPKLVEEREVDCSPINLRLYRPEETTTPAVSVD